LPWMCWLKIGQKCGDGTCGCCHLRSTKCVWEPEDKNKVPNVGEDDSPQRPRKRAHTTPLSVHTSLPPTISALASLPPFTSSSSANTLLHVETNSLLKSIVEQLKLLNENVAKFSKSESDNTGDESKTSSNIEVSSPPKTQKRQLATIIEEEEKPQEDDGGEKDDENAEDDEETSSSGESMDEDGSEEGEVRNEEK
ncbi:MAG TPA: hypothetical protein VGO47_06345, partial [Chlamydiales bacterium]|nr:hypothetical protein [Chlamydiales bacterium]